MANIFTGIGNLIARAVLVGLNSRNKCQLADVELIAGEKKSEIEHIEPYGFTSAALDEAEAVVLFPSGDRSHGVVIAVADRRYRLQGLKRGEVAIYTDEGDSIVLKRGKLVEVTTSQLIVNASSKIVLNTPVIEASGAYKGAGDVSDKSGSMQAMRDAYNPHTHANNGSAPPSSKMN